MHVIQVIALAARDAIRGVSEWPFAHELAGDSAALVDWLSDSIRTVWANHTDPPAAMAVIEEITISSFTSPKTGTVADPDGENGSFTAHVKIYHGLSQWGYWSRTETVTGTIIKVWKKEDANGNGRVTTSDINAIVNHLLGKTPQTFIIQAADVNGNGRVTTTDINLIVNYLLSDR